MLKHVLFNAVSEVGIEFLHLQIQQHSIRDNLFNCLTLLLRERLGATQQCVVNLNKHARSPLIHQSLNSAP